MTGFKKTYHHIGSRAASVANAVRTARANGGKITGLSTGFPKLDDMLDGLRKSTLTVVGARPKQGKTALAVSIIRNLVRAGTEVYFASLEMPSDEIIRRFVAIEAGVPYETLTRGRYDDDDELRIEDAFEAVARWPLMIDDSRMTVSSIWGQAEYAVHKEGAKAVFVDYMQYITPAATASRYEAVTNISMGLAEMRKALDRPIFSLAQLSRRAAERANEIDFNKFNAAASRPKDNDLRDSGQIEQDADSLLFLNRPEVYLEDMKPSSLDKEVDWECCISKFRGKAEIILHYNRNGRRGILDYRFNGPVMSFVEA